MLSQLLFELRHSIRQHSWWGQPLGSSQLWGQHVQTIDRIDAIAASIGTTSFRPDGNEDGNESDNGQQKPTFQDLPKECLREILFRLADHKDILNAAEAYSLADRVSAEQWLWKRLCRFHYSAAQINFAVKEMLKENQKDKASANRVINRNNRAGRHPYHNSVNINNNSSSSSSNNNNCNWRPSVTRAGRNQQPGDADTEAADASLNDNCLRSTGRVSDAFRQHLNRQRETLQQVLDQEQPISFQDVRNHFDQRMTQENQPPGRSGNSASLKRQWKHSREDEDKSEFNGSSSASNQTDWEDVYHRLRRCGFFLDGIYQIKLTIL